MKEGSKIKLFVDARCFDKEHQGTRAFIKRIYHELYDLAPNIEFYFGARDTERLKREFEGLANCHFVRYRFSSTLIRLFFEVPTIIWRYKIDLAHFQYIVPFIKNCKFIVTTHDVIFKELKNDFSWSYRFSRSILFGRGLRKSEILTTVSSYSQQSIAKHFNIAQDKIVILPNGINPAYSSSVDKTKSLSYISARYQLNKYVLYVSRFEPRKNHSLLLKIFHELNLAKSGYQLVLLGHKSIRSPEFERYYESLPVDIKNCIFHSDKTDDAELFHFYRAAAAFVYPSKAEGFGLPPIEAAALGVPVICSNLTAMGEYTFFGKNHVDPMSTSQLKERLMETLSSPPDNSELLKIANTVKTLYNAKNTAQTLNRAIQKLFSGRI